MTEVTEQVLDTDELLPDEAPDEEPTEEEKETPRMYPEALSTLLASVIPDENLVVAIGAGDGSIFDSPSFLPDYCLGMESEEKLYRKRQGTYTNLGGEFDKALTLLDPLDFQFPHTIIDLTRGLSQSVVAEVQARQKDKQVTVVIQPLDHQPVNPVGLAASVLLPDLELAVRFLLREEDFRPGTEPVERTATLDTLDLLGAWVSQHLANAVEGYYRRLENTHGRYDRHSPEEWRIVHKEYGRRFIRDAEARAYDLNLVGGKLIQTTFGGWATKVLQRDDHYSALSSLHNKTVNTFAQNPAAYDLMIEQVEAGIIFVDPRLVEVGAVIVHEARFTTSPLYDLPVPMRTAFVQEATTLTCIKTDEKRGFYRGQTYSFRAYEPQPIERHFYRYVEDRKTGDVVMREHKWQIRFLAIRIAGELFRDVDTDDLRYLVRHFRLPNPGSLATRYPEKVESAMELVETVEEKHLTPRGFTLRDFQRRDIAMHLAKGSGVLAWEQGLGKTLGGLVFMLASFEKPGTQRAGLIITAQDLMLQWKAEAKKFLNIDLEQIGGTEKSQKQADGSRKNIGPYLDIVNARRIAQKLRDPDESGLYITYYEALSQTGRDLRPKEEPFVVAVEKRTRWVEGDWELYEDEEGNKQRRYVPAHEEEYDFEKWSTDYCPACHQGWNGSFCYSRARRELPDGSTERSKRICGYSVYGKRSSDQPSGRAPTIAHLLTNAFRRGVIVVDEGTMIGGSAAGGDSARSLAVRGMTARYRLLMSGTPVKNFITQAFWLLWWTLGNKSKRFDYSYRSGRAEFADTFTVFQWIKDDDGAWGPKKAVGEITNLSRFWRLGSSSMTRRTQDNCGEEVQPVKYHVMETPLGIHQREQIEFLRLNSGQLFIEKGQKLDPPERRSENGLGALGFLDTKWNYACTMPQADPDWEWTHVPVSNWTPMTLKTLETVMALVKQGRKVLLGTDLVASVTFLADALREKGVDALPLIDASGKTLDPKKRAKAVQDFKEGDTQVLVSTAAAMKLGHSLEVASAVVIHGLTWDYETFSQYALRVRRLTSKRPIDVFVMLPGKESHTIVGRKWTTLKDKTKGIGKALDGVLTDAQEEPVDQAAILRELREKGLPIVGNEVEEREVEKTWRNTPLIHEFEIPEEFLAKLASDQAHEQDWTLCADCERPMGSHPFWGDIAICDEKAVELKETVGQAWFDPTEKLSWELLAMEYTGCGLAVPEYITKKLGEFDHSSEELEAAEAVGQFFEAGFQLMRDEQAAAEAVGDFLQALMPTQEEEVEEQEVEEEPQPVMAAPIDLSSIRKELLEYKELHELEVLTDEEFADIKAALIAQLKAATTAPQAAPAKQREPVASAASSSTEQLSLIA